MMNYINNYNKTTNKINSIQTQKFFNKHINKKQKYDFKKNNKKNI